MSAPTDNNNTTTTTNEVSEGVKQAEHVVEDSSFRYLAYAARLRTIITAGARYLAYTSDVGMCFSKLLLFYLEY